MRWGQCSESERLLVVGQFAHTRHAQIARRVNLSQGCGIAEDPKSAVCSPASRTRQQGAFRDRHGRWVWDAVDAAASGA